MGDTKDIQKPSDLYQFPWEQEEKKERQTEFFNRQLTPDELKIINSQ